MKKLLDLMDEFFDLKKIKHEKPKDRPKPTPAPKARNIKLEVLYDADIEEQIKENLKKIEDMEERLRFLEMKYSMETIMVHKPRYKEYKLEPGCFGKLEHAGILCDNCSYGKACYDKFHGRE